KLLLFLFGAQRRPSGLEHARGARHHARAALRSHPAIFQEYGDAITLLESKCPTNLYWYGDLPLAGHSGQVLAHAWMCLPRYYSSQIVVLMANSCTQRTEACESGGLVNSSRGTV